LILRFDQVYSSKNVPPVSVFTTPEARRFLEFFAEGKRSFARARSAAAEVSDAG